MYYSMVSMTIYLQSKMFTMTHLDAVVAISKVLHGLELLVDDTDASLVCAVNNTLNIGRSLAHGLELLVQTLSSFYSSLRVELSYSSLALHVRQKLFFLDLPG